jgi:predicted SAM-dependent methyltransferase
MNKIKLHLGAGNKHIDGYTNIDIRYMPGIDIVDNVKFLRRYKSNSVDVIYASHVLEHFSRWDYKTVLSRWFEILKPGGILRLAVPDFEQICKIYSSTGDIDPVMGLIYGGQDYDENFHYCCWDINSIRKDLTGVGFKAVDRYDWRNTDHSHIDDYSQAYIPFMDKDNGTLMSLNIEAVK